MACKLTTSADPKADLEGSTDAEVTITIESKSGKAFIVSMAYPHDTPLKKDATGNWVFKVLKSYNQLGILVEDPNRGDLVKIQEDCGGGTKNTLRQYNFDPVGPTQFFSVK